MNEEETFYHVSFVVIGSNHPGGIISVDERPSVGQTLRFGGQAFEVLEVQELSPGFFHVTCKVIEG